MALHLPLHFPITSLSHPKFRKLNKLTPILLKPITFLNQTPLKFTTRATSSEEEDKPIKTDEKTDEISDIGSEIRKAMKEREEREEEREVGFWDGVAKEVKEIEWPAFGKVVGTTGVVLGVIAGSSVVLLTVNAVFAELSDRVFAGRGVQDFFG